MSDGQDVVAIAEKYYDSDEADQFYFNIWGGEDIHIGLYESPYDPVRVASRRAVVRLAEELDGLGAGTRVLDIGAGYGGAARSLARDRGFQVTCLNLSETQNARNRELTEAQGLADRIRVVHGNFEEIPADAASFDVVWSEDAILHSGRRRQVLAEVARVLVPGGRFVFTDPMQSDGCPNGVLQPVLDRIHLDSLGSFAFYRRALDELGFEEVACNVLTDHLISHYSRVREELTGRYEEICRVSSRDYVDRMLRGLEHWIEAGRRGHLAWGILHFRLR